MVGAGAFPVELAGGVGEVFFGLSVEVDEAFVGVFDEASVVFSDVGGEPEACGVGLWECGRALFALGSGEFAEVVHPCGDALHVELAFCIAVEVGDDSEATGPAFAREAVEGDGAGGDVGGVARGGPEASG